MAIAPEFARFSAKKEPEKEFTDHILIPLLQRLGFTAVVNYHGCREFGKDLVFAEIDRFGHVVYHGLQSKFLESLSISESHKLIEDAREAFVNPFTHPQTGTKERISTFYVANGGSISEQARTNYFNALTPQYGANVRLFDGPGLIALDRMAANSRTTFVRERLTGLILEMKYNMAQSTLLHAVLDKHGAGEGYHLSARFRFVATLSMLEHPLILDDKFLLSLHTYWLDARMLNHLLDQLVMPVSYDAYADSRLNRSIELLESLLTAGYNIFKRVSNELSKLGLASL